MTPFGLGDLAHYALRPAVLLYDAAYGTDLRDCIECKRRRKLWNSWAPHGGTLLLIFFVTTFIFMVSY